MLSKIFKNQLNKERFYLILLITTLVVIWFKKGLILGSGESGLPFYNTSKLLELTMNSWTDVPFGTSGSIGSASYPFYLAVTFLQNIGIPSFLIQAFVYWFLFVLGTLSIHKIASLIPGNSALTRITSALFYIFNPVTHISVLHRFQYTMLFFYHFLPFGFLIYYLGLKYKKIIYPLILSLLCAVFSFTFIGISFIQLFFGVLGFLTFWYFIYNFKQKKDFFPFLYFTIFLVTFGLINIWWIAPLLTAVSSDLGSGGSLKYFDSQGNVETFKAISSQIKSILSVFRLFKPNDYPIGESSWGWLYNSVPFVVLSFVSIIAFAASLFKKGKGMLLKFLTFTSLATMFLMKGSLAPLGEITLFFFQLFPLLHSFRNPFEKIGLLLPFVMAIPIGFGIAMIINFLVKKLNLSRSVLVVTILTLIYPLFMFPILTGYAFTSGPPPANNMDVGQYVKVPEYYREAREWLDKQNELFRVLVLPMNGEGMTYQWDYGYSGVELSNNLFNHSMISFISSQAFLPEMIKNINDVFFKYPDRSWVLAQLFNVKYVMVRDDVDYIGREMEPPAKVLETMSKKMGSDFSLVAEFGRLKFFELNPEKFYKRIFATTTPVYLFDNLDQGLSLMPLSNPEGEDMFITTAKSPTEDPYFSLAKRVVINGTRVENIEIDTKNPIENLPFIGIFRNTPFYALVRLKEDFQEQFQPEDKQLAFRVNLLGKRLVEINYAPENVSAIEEYDQDLKKVSEDLLSAKILDRAIAESLVNHKEVLEQIKEKTSHKDTVNQIIVYMDRLFVDIRARSVHPTQRSLIHRFDIPRDSKYEILIAKDDWDSYYVGDRLEEFDLDGQTIKLDSVQQVNDKDTISLGVYPLAKGVHEVSITPPQVINLIAEKLPEELILSSQDRKPFTRTIPIANLDSNYSYVLTFEYLEEKGDVPVIGLHSDMDFWDKDGVRIPRLGIALSRNNYDFGWKRYSARFSPIPAAKEHFFSIKIIPYGDCKAVVERPYRRYCEDKSFSQRFLRDSSTKIRDLRVEKSFFNPVFLREVKLNSPERIVPEVSFEKISPARYKVKITNARNPFFLVLSTTFNPQWQAYFTTTKPKNMMEVLSESTSGDVVPSENHLVANGYANGWYIDKTGSYEMFLEYSPERVFIIGRKLSFGFIIIALLTLVVYKKYARTNK